jgi:hypothetical protein
MGLKYNPREIERSIQRGDLGRGFLIYGTWRLDQGDRETISDEIKRNFATDLCTPT